MRHRVAGRKLARTKSHRVALRRNLVQSLFEHGQIVTTLPRAKEVRPMAEKLITLAKRGDLHARRLANSIMRDREIFKEAEPGKGDYEYGGRVLAKLFDEIGPKFRDRNGGYTRIVKLAGHRIGDGGSKAILMLLGQEVAPGGTGGGGESRRRQKAASKEAAAGASRPEPETNPNVVAPAPQSAPASEPGAAPQ